MIPLNIFQTFVQQPYSMDTVGLFHEQISKAEKKRRAEEKNDPSILEEPDKPFTDTEKLQQVLEKIHPEAIQALRNTAHPSWKEPLDKALTYDDAFCRDWFHDYYPRESDKPVRYKETWEDVLDRCAPLDTTTFNDVAVSTSRREIDHYAATRNFIVTTHGQRMVITSRRREWVRTLQLPYLPPISAATAAGEVLYTGHKLGNICRWDLAQGTYTLCIAGDTTKPRDISTLVVSGDNLCAGDIDGNITVYNGDRVTEKIAGRPGRAVTGIAMHNRTKKGEDKEPPKKEARLIASFNDGTIACWRLDGEDGPKEEWAVDHLMKTTCGLFVHNGEIYTGVSDIIGDHSDLYQITIDSGEEKFYRQDCPGISRFERVHNRLYYTSSRCVVLLGDTEEEDLSFSIGEHENRTFRLTNHFQGMYTRKTLKLGSDPNAPAVTLEYVHEMICRDYASNTANAVKTPEPVVTSGRKITAVALSALALLVILAAIPFLPPVWRRITKKVIAI